jgi:hypothetical protein
MPAFLLNKATMSGMEIWVLEFSGEGGIENWNTVIFIRKFENIFSISKKYTIPNYTF